MVLLLLHPPQSHELSASLVDAIRILRENNERNSSRYVTMRQERLLYKEIKSKIYRVDEEDNAKVYYGKIQMEISHLSPISEDNFFLKKNFCSLATTTLLKECYTAGLTMINSSRELAVWTRVLKVKNKCEFLFNHHLLLYHSIKRSAIISSLNIFFQEHQRLSNLKNIQKMR